MSSPTAAVLDQPIYIVVRPDSQFVYLCTSLWSEVQSHSDDSHLTAPCSASALGQTHPTMACIYLVIIVMTCSI